jgi:hypothetical protein
MVHSTNVLTYGLSSNNKKKDGFLRLIVFTTVKIMSTDKEIVGYLFNKILTKIDLLISAIVHDHNGFTMKGCHINGRNSSCWALETPAAVVAAKAEGQQ